MRGMEVEHSVLEVFWSELADPELLYSVLSPSPTV